MSVNNTSPVIGYNTNGVTTSFSFPFKILEAADLKVSLSVSGLPGYTVVFNSDDEGGQVNFATAPPAGLLELRRDVTLDRSTDYQYQGELPSDVLNNDLDRVVMMVQQQDLWAQRSIKMPATDTTDQVLSQNAEERANKALIFDSDGNITVSQDNYADQATDAAFSAAAAADSASSAQSNQFIATAAASSATLSASQALYYAQHGTGFAESTFYDLGSVADSLTIFNTDLGGVP
ncbi:hypothetical protein [Herbaspirillum aquaticum]|uniref:Uncharacterized protein n=1 Tax=Herbaspirillum aquaticum TaxID=568783 RepID=A0A225SVT9_9BURK|nr:hypothetical protein [Herbaspirillum aquaticum]OWY35306.1 hypothetical protein CEJ45_08515 [Herbaspirillum aquaticum]